MKFRARSNWSVDGHLMQSYSSSLDSVRDWASRVAAKGYKVDIFALEETLLETVPASSAQPKDSQNA